MKCKKCGSEMKINFGFLLTSNPPLYECECVKCGEIDYITEELFPDAKQVIIKNFEHEGAKVMKKYCIVKLKENKLYGFVWCIKNNDIMLSSDFDYVLSYENLEEAKCILNLVKRIDTLEDYHIVEFNVLDL